MMGFNFSPRGWAFCDGQILPINQNQSLFSLLGTSYGGDGRTSFALPDLRGRTARHPGGNIGQRGGEEMHTLDAAEMPLHNHRVEVTSVAGAEITPTGNFLAQASITTYATSGTPALVAMNAGSTTPAGGGQAHENRQPYAVINFCIALQGLFPSRN